MTQEDKQLLLIDLCARLPYGVKMKYKDEEGVSTLCQIDTFYTDIDGFHCLIRMAEPPGIFYDLNEFKPYLRPMSSMTEEEENEFISLNAVPSPCQLPNHTRMSWYSNATMLDWLNAHHFDYRGLITMGLALEAPERMYKTE